MNVPEWVHEMMSEKPNVYKTQQLYRSYYEQHPFEKNNFTQYYKKWMHYALWHTNQEGFIEANLDEQPFYDAQRGGGSIWSSIGPFETLWE
jgi:hypothetical protein